MITTLASNKTLKINRAISTSTTVNSDCYAKVDYRYTGSAGTIAGAIGLPVTLIFGPSQSIPSTITVVMGGVGNVTFGIQGGVEFINSP